MTTTTLTKPQIEQKLRELIAEHVGVEESQITPESRFIQDLGCDSLDFLVLLMAAEVDFDFDITDEDAYKLSTVQDAVEFVAREKGANT